MRELLQYSTLGRNLKGGGGGYGVWGCDTPQSMNHLVWQGGGGYGVWGCDTPQSMNHLVWQGESSGLAGQSKIINDRMYRVIK